MELKQENMPNAGVAENSTDMGSHSSATINSGGVAYITGEPAMPQLKAEIKGAPATLSIDWKLEIKSERTERGTKDDKNYPASGYKTLPGNQAWDIGAEFGQDFNGGKCKLFYKINGNSEQIVEFSIRGKNPMDDDAKTYIQGVQGSHWYAWAIAEHESRQTKVATDRVFNQFNTDGGSKEKPNFGAPDGWGMFQRDPSHGGVQPTTKEVYSWHENTTAVLAEFEKKRQEAQRYFDAVKRTFPTKWEEPPASYTETGTTTATTAMEAAIITMYNGASVVWSLKNQFGTYDDYASCWEFRENNPSGSRWHYKVNPKNYLYKVFHDEYEGHLPYSE